MQRVARNNLNFIDSPSFKHLADRTKQISPGELYQHTLLKLLTSFEVKNALGSVTDQLVSLAERAFAARQYEFLGVVGQVLLDLASANTDPSVGLYYYALHLNAGGSGDLKTAEGLFERVAHEGKMPFKARAMLALARNSYLGSDLKTAERHFGEAGRMLALGNTFDPVTAMWTTQGLAVMRSMDGDHCGALADLENLKPIARAAGLVQPAAYYDYLNSIAVEWAQAGRLEEARHIARKTNASAYVSVYPTWRETLQDIESKSLRASQSVVPVSQIPSAGQDAPTQIVSWLGGSVRATDFGDRRSTRSARIINLHDWKKKLEKKSNGNTQKKPSLEQTRAMTLEEKQATITRCVYSDEVTEEMLDSILQVTLGSETGERDEV